MRDDGHEREIAVVQFILVDNSSGGWLLNCCCTRYDGREMILWEGGMKWTEGTKKDNQVDMNFDLISSVLLIDQDSELRLLSGPKVGFV